MKPIQASADVAASPAETPDNNPLVLAIQLQQQGRETEAEALFRQILQVAPTNAAALYSLTVILLNSARREEALRCATNGTNANPGFAPLWLVQGSALQALHRREEALVSYDRALQLNPQYLEVLVNSGVLLREMRRHPEALERFRRVLEIDPEYEVALGNYGILLTEFKQGAQAVDVFERLMRKNPNYPFGLGLLCYERMHLCDWTGLEEATQRIKAGVRGGSRVCKTLGFMALSDSAREHLLCAEVFAKTQHQTRPVPLWQGEAYGHDRLRIAYVSPDLREHPVGHLMAGVIEAHDKSRFETVAVSLGPDDGSRIRARMLASFDHFIDAQDMHPRKIAELMRQMEIDIAIDLAGYTSDARTEVFLNRPAPIQVNYLGYPGTMALECYDYIIADRTVIPEEHRCHYTEQVAYLEHCYLPVASGIKVPQPLPRSAYGLPEKGFVFCAFSHDYKIHPKMFAIWMRLLKSTPGSVIWLMSRNEISQKNLRLEAQRHNVNPDRLVFATRVPKVEDHLARYRVADLFLDTWPYNAHTTAADALLAGLPVITYKGDAFPARVAASLLETLGFPGLVTDSFEGYFKLASRLAHDSKRLTSLRKKLASIQLQGHPFLGASFTRSLEQLFSTLAASAPQSPERQKSATSVVQLRGEAQPAPKLPLASTPQLEVYLGTAQDLFRQGNLPQAELYLRQYLANGGKSATAAELLEDLRRAYGMLDGFELSERSGSLSQRSTRFLLIRAWGYGFWSDVHHVASQLLLAELTCRTPIILWGSNSLFRNASDVDAFGHFFQEVSPTRLEDIPLSATIYPPKWSRENLYHEDVQKWEGDGSRLAAQYLFHRPETLVVSDFFSTISSIIPWIGRSSQYFGRSFEELYAEMFQKYLTPVPRITGKADAFFDKQMRGRPWVGVHVRGSDKIHESPHLAATNAAYLGVVDRIVELNPQIGVFLLTDSLPAIEDFKRRYGTRLLCTEAARSGSSVGVHYMSDKEGVAIGEEVLLDVLLALKCDYFVGNRESNVSVAVASMRQWPKGRLVLLGNKDIRSDNLFLHQRERVGTPETVPTEAPKNAIPLVSDQLQPKGASMDNRSIDVLHRNKVGKVSDKWESYLRYYDALFGPLRDRPISLMEIGVQNGGSLETWAQYFTSAERFIGCDIDPQCGKLKYDDPRIRIVVGDANSAPTFQEIRSISPEFDVVIDDGSHVSTDIINSFVNYFPLLKPGGIFVVEDTHTLYDDNFGGGILNEFSAYSFFKKLIDVVSYQFWRDQLAINTYFRTFFPLHSTPAFILQGWVESIEFRNSIITITKSLTPGHEKLGARIIVGNSAQVQTWNGHIPAER